MEATHKSSASGTFLLPVIFRWFPGVFQKHPKLSPITESFDEMAKLMACVLLNFSLKSLDHFRLSKSTTEAAWIWNSLILGRYSYADILRPDLKFEKTTIVHFKCRTSELLETMLDDSWNLMIHRRITDGDDSHYLAAECRPKRDIVVFHFRSLSRSWWVKEPRNHFVASPTWQEKIINFIKLNEVNVRRKSNRFSNTTRPFHSVNTSLADNWPPS